MIPKVVGYSGFSSYGGLPYSSMKPGQVKLERDYYKDANRVKPDGKTYLGTYSRFGSNHQYTVDRTVKPTDYKRVSRVGKQNTKYEYLHDPELFKHTKMGKMYASQQNFHNQPRASTELRTAGAGATQTATDKLYKTTNHWTTNYQGENDRLQGRPSSQAQRPFWSYPKREHVARRTFFKTEYHNTLGTYGQNPRDKLPSTSTKLENENNELTIGSTKVTSHIPGYGGYLVKTDFNDKALEHGKNTIGRGEIKNKINVTENFNVKIPGYAGYKPLSCLNNKGNVRPKLFSTQGETFF